MPTRSKESLAAAALRVFLVEQLRITNLRVYINNGTIALLGLLKNPPARGSVISIEAAKALNYKPGSKVNREEIDYSVHRKLVVEMFLCRYVDNFLTYLVELLGAIYHQRHDMLRSTETVTTDFVLQYGDVHELRKALAERRVERLAYLGMRELAKSIKEHHGFDLFPAGTDLEKAILLVEMRNLVVHNRGIVSKISATRSHSLEPHVGKAIPLKYDELVSTTDFLTLAVQSIHKAAIKKFQIV